MHQSILATVDVALFSIQDRQLRILLVQRSKQPALGRWALPGGFVHNHADFDLLAAAQRVIGLKTGFDPPYLEQVGSVGNATRDPRGWSITILYFALMTPQQVAGFAEGPGLGSEPWAWVGIDQAQHDRELAFDHAGLIRQAHQRLKNKASYSSLAFLLMAPSFTLNELQEIYELLTGQILDKKAFRRRLQNSGLLEETGLVQAGKTRSAKLYRLVNKELAWFERPTVGQRK